MWPRMTREELARVFPDGRTVHIPTDGRPLPGYALALADIRKRGNSPSENSIEAARNAGVDVGALVASNEHAGFHPFAKLFGRANDEEDEDADAGSATASAEPTAATPQGRQKSTVVAALEHAAAKTVAVARAGMAAAPKLIRVSRAEAAQPPAAAAAPPPDQTPGRFAALSPNQIITARGYWQGLPDATSAVAQSPSKAAPGSRLTQVASADPAATGSVSSSSVSPSTVSSSAVTPWPTAAVDHVAPELALAYAEPTAEHDAPANAVALAATATRAAAGSAAELMGQNATTIAVKGVIDRPQTSIQRAIQLASAAVKVGTRFDNPWLRAIVLSPSVQRFLTTLALGERDFTTLASLMVKPASSVMMTFSPDPNSGLSQDHFSGSAIVFLSTVTYPTHTAALQ
jgi:hypothetical protein